MGQNQSNQISASKYDFENQSVEIDEKEHIRVCTSMKGKPLTETIYKDVHTLCDVLQKGKILSSDGACLGDREGPGKGPYKWQTYSQVLEKVKHIGSGLMFKGIAANNDTKIGIYSANRSDWIISEQACYHFSLTVVSLYDSYGKDAIKYILNHAEIQVVFLDTFKRLETILEALNEGLDHLKFVVHFDRLSSIEKDKIKDVTKIEIISFDELLEIGKSNPTLFKRPKPEDAATICYTSGTTGLPKGAILSHMNIISNGSSLVERLNCPDFNYNRYEPRVVHISYLPLAHMLERMASIFALLGGGQIGFLSGDIAKLADDLVELKPTDFPVVPRILNRVYNQVKGKTAGSCIKEHLLLNAVRSKENDMKRGIYNKSSFYDRLIFNDLRERFGGRVARMATGSAPIANEVMMFARAAFGCPIPEGYGQTESSCAITFSHPFDPQIGHCGPPLSSYMVKLIDVPEMDYFARNNQGEICAKGPSRFLGYLKDPEKTAETIDKDGWLHTGDIGMWLPNGTLKIIDRKKNLFKLSQGEYISPEKIENTYIKSRFVAQVFVDGNSLKDFVVAVVVPDVEYLTETCQSRGINDQLNELCKKKDVRKLVLEDLVRIGKAAGLMSYEQVKNVHLHPEQMSQQNGMLTPTLKLKRFEVRTFFKSTIEQLYEEGAI